MLQAAVQVLDVVHRLRQNTHFRQFLDLTSGGNMLSQSLKPFIDCLHPLPLSIVPLDGLQFLLRFYLVAVDGVEGHQLSFRSHPWYLALGLS